MPLKVENVPDRAHSELEFHKQFGDSPAMHILATPQQVSEFQRLTPRDFYVFGVARQFPVVRFDFPACAMLDGSAASLEKLSVEGRPREALPFQIAVWTPCQALRHLRVEAEGFPLPVRIFLQERRKSVNLVANSIQVFWCMVELPDGQADIRGMFRIVADGFDDVTLPCAIAVRGDVLADGGESDDNRLARLRWLDSDIGEPAPMPEDFTPLARRGRTLACLGRTLTLTDDGLPQAADSFFCGCNQSLADSPTHILAAPFRFRLLDADGAELPSAAADCAFTEESAQRICWKGRREFAGGIALTVSGFLDYDGFCSFDCILAFSAPCRLQNIALTYEAFGGDFIGLNRHGGAVPRKLRWLWDVQRNQDAFWLGGIHAGHRLRLRDRNSHTPLTNCYYHFMPLALPEAWNNGGEGGIALDGDGERTAVTAFSGPRTVRGGDVLDFGFEFQLTPIKLTNPERHFTQRFFHPYMHDLPKALEDTFTPDFFAQLRADGVQVINIHHALRENPFINAPMTGASLPYLRRFVEMAHGENLKVCLYYTIRELSLHLPEFWPFASLRGEILFSGPGNEARPVTAPHGAHPYIQQNCRFGYLSAWSEPIKEGPLKGELDLAVETAVHSRRMENYYLEGLRYMLERCPFDGLYLDDISLSREGFKRLLAVFRQVRRREPILTLHSWNPFQARNDNYGANSPVLRDMEFYGFATSLWLGEAFDYQTTSPDYYLTEISGLPFGQMSEMLKYGGNPWKGILFGMTGRYGWLADPRELWKVMDRVDIPHCRMMGFFDVHPAVITSSPDVKATLYVHPDGRRALLAVASWASRQQNVRLEFDATRLPPAVAGAATLTAPAIPGFQTAAVYASDDELPVPPGKGLLLEINV